MDEGDDDYFQSASHAEQMMLKMDAYFDKQQLCDVVLVLPGPRRIPAHRIVLSSASDYFSAMFTSDVLEATQNEVNMKDVDPDAMTALVKYMYDGKLEIKEDTVENLLSTACLLQLDTVISACCSFLSKQLHPSNCLGIRQFADTQGCSQLYREANDYVVEHFVDVMHNQEFVAMPVNEVARLLANDSLNVMNEEMVFHALVLWAKHDMAVRKKHLSKLLVHIKLPLLSPQVCYSSSVLFTRIVTIDI